MNKFKYNFYFLIILFHLIYGRICRRPHKYMIRQEHPFDIMPDLRKAASTKADSTKAASVIRPNQIVRKKNTDLKENRSATCQICYLPFNRNYSVILAILQITSYALGV